jgi:pimeloyl-ACP methyl ester carboxylesterase
MASFEHDGARIHYEEIGDGDPILTTHGLSENGTYWSLTGVADRLATRYRVISMDMRGHGRTRVACEPPGFDADTLARDIGALADHLGLERFHLLSHATGGMVALRYAMTAPARLSSLMLTDCGAATAFSPDQATNAALNDAIARHFEGRTWPQILQANRAHPEPFLQRLSHNAEPARCWATVDAIMRLGHPDTLAAFCRAFYTDPDPHIDRLRAIDCPTLVLLGEHDVLFFEPSALLAREIRGARLAVMRGIGHMTAIEAPAGLARELLDFLELTDPDRRS